MDLDITISLFLIVAGCTYWWIRRNYTYWQRMGVPCIEPTFPYGNKEFSKPTKIFDLHLADFYNQLKGKGPVGGLYLMVGNAALALDISFVKQVLIKDFQYFQDRGVYFNEKDDPLSAHLFALNQEKWRSLRNKLSPTFTSGKMKYMFPTMVDVSKKFHECLNGLVGDASKELEMRDLSARFTTDVIGTCAFGIECNSLSNPETEFRVIGRKVFSQQRHSQLLQGLISGFPNISRMLGIKLTLDEVSDFFLNIVDQTVKLREQNNIKRNDFMDILIGLKNRKDDPLSFNEIAAQAFIFFLAGFETSSTTMQYILYELAMNPDIQQKARNEIEEVLEKNNGEFTYDAMMGMQYMEQLINETLRKYPPFGTLIRVTTKDYKVPDTNIMLRKGTFVLISNYAIQHDPDIYPDPEKFIPERFTAEEMAKRDSVTFITFGDGPRNCIGLRFGMMQLRVGLVTLLRNFEILKGEKTPETIEFDKNGPVMAPVDGMWLKLKKL